MLSMLCTYWFVVIFPTFAYTLEKPDTVFQKTEPLDSTVQQLQLTTVNLSRNTQDNVISGKQLFGQSAENLARSLEFEKHFSRRSMGPAPARPVVRGLGGDHVQISENGNRISDLSGTSPDHAVSLSQTHVRELRILEDVNVLPYSLCVVGARIEADRGLFLIDAENRLNWRWNSLVQSSAPGAMSAVQMELPVSAVTARMQTSGARLFDARSPDRTLENTDACQWDIAGGLQSDIASHRIGTDLQHYSMEYGIPGGFIGAHRDGVRISMKRSSFHAGHVLQSGLDTVRSVLSYNRFSQVETEVNGPVGAEFLVKELDFRTDWNIRRFGLQWKTGVSGGLEDRQYGGFVYTPYTRRIKGAVWGIGWVESTAWPLEFGARIEATSDRLSGIYAQRNSVSLPERQFISHSVYTGVEKQQQFWRLRGGLFQTSRIPTVEELYSQGPHLAAWSYDRGNEHISREIGYGAKASFQTELSGWKADVESYGSYYSDYIRTRPSGKVNWATQLPEYTVQGGEALLWGVATSVQSPWWYHLRFFSQWDYTFGHDLSIDEPVPAISPARWQNTISWLWKSHSLRMRSVYYFAQNRVSRFEEANPSNHVLHSDYSWQKSYGGLLYRLQIGLDNILNQEYTNHLSRIKAIFPEPERSVYAKLLLLY